jgi:hypothetical protein
MGEPQPFLPQGSNGAPLIVQPAYLPKQGGLPDGANMVPIPAQGATTQYYSFPEQGSAAQQQQQYYAFPETGDTAAVLPLPEQGSAAVQYYTQGTDNSILLPLGAVPLPPQGSTTQYYTLPEQGAAAVAVPEMIPAQGVVAQNRAVPLPAQGSTTQYYSFPEQGAAETLLRQQQQLPLPEEGSSPKYYYEFPEQGSSPKYYYEFPEQGAVATKPRVGVAYTEDMMNNGQRPLMQAQPPSMGRAQPKHHTNLRHKQQNVKYYFYDPRTTGKDKKGHFHLPQIVYDTFGRAVSLQSLSAAAPGVYLEPPPDTTMTHYNISSNATIYNYTHTHPPVVETRQKRKTMSLPDTSTWGDSTAADSSIIVCTVGVMALLVGALSARRMRSRSILASCIENESLEDDAAYDTAYTTSAGASNHYNTFQQGWKGDLEKFDV